MENMDTSAPSMSCSATFQQGGQTYHLFANAALVAVAQSYDILLKLIPFIAGVCPGGNDLFPVLFQAAGGHQQRGETDDHLGHDMEVRCTAERRDRCVGRQPE